MQMNSGGGGGWMQVSGGGGEWLNPGDVVGVVVVEWGWVVVAHIG